MLSYPRIRRYLAIALTTLALLARAHFADGQAAKVPLPSLDPVLGKGADAAWTRVSGDYTVAPDNSLARPILTVGKTALVLEGKARSAGAYEIKALVRLSTKLAPAAAADFYLAKKDAMDPGLHMSLSANKTLDYIAAAVTQNAKPLHDAAAMAKTLDWEPAPSTNFTYYVRAYSLRDIRPGWPEDFRVRIEHDMAALPGPGEKWLECRIQVRPGEVRFWLDDHLVAHKRSPEILSEGVSRLELSPGVEIAGYDVAPWTPTPGFEPIRLGGYANARAFLGTAAVAPTSLPVASTVPVAGIPFLFSAINPEGKDHIDVGQSLYRQANLEGYFPSYEHRWIGSSRRDPARIQLRIPNGQFDALYMLAASDDRHDALPLVTAMFFRPGAGFAENFETEVPLATAQATGVTAFPVKLTDGRQVNLWLVKIPLDPGRLSAFADMDIVEVELTKKVHQFRSYPDPFIYGWHQAGPPSAVHVYAATLAEVPVGFEFVPDRFGHVWTAPAVPAYTATLSNRTASDQTGKLTIETRSHDGTELSRQEFPIRLAKSQTLPVKVSIPVKLNGYHDVKATLDIAGKQWTEKRSLVRLAPDTRSARWTPGQGALFGYWSYHGGHHTPKADHHIELMTEAGARTSIGIPNPKHPLVLKHWTRAPAGAWEVAPQPWAAEQPVDPKKYAAYQKTVVEAFTNARKAIPVEYQPDHVYFFPEPHVSTRLTEGNYPTYWNAPEYQMTADEQKNLRTFFVTAQCAAEAIRRQWPDLKILIPWGDALFAVPLLRAGFPRNLIDGSGIDTPGFERLPEMQLHQIAIHRLYELRKEYARAGISQPRLQYTEGIFVPTEVGGVDWREQMDLYNRWTLISMAYGIERFYSGWFAFDCGNYYGSEHYGGCGIQRRIPYCDPKPAYAAYATMTDKLDQANFDGWLKTGSLTNYCLRFKGPKGYVYALWNIRGKRPVTLNLTAPRDVVVTDAMNNATVFSAQNPQSRQVTISTSPSVVYVTGAEIASISLGEQDNSDVQPAAGAPLVADLGDGSWSSTTKRDPIYEKGTFAMMRYPGKFSTGVVADPDHGNVLSSRLEKQAEVHELMPWYQILVPKKPIVFAGAPSALGIWVKGASDWGRIIYTLRDAKGERWTSIGTQDQYNCDDVHSWSAFNFDGWRYLRFELPGHTGYDNFRKHGTTWWRSDHGDGVVDLPVQLENIIVEQRSHVLYVNDVQPVSTDTVCLGKIYAEYASLAAATAEAVAISKLRMPVPAGVPDLPNPIAEMQRDGIAAPTAIVKLDAPLDRNDGTLVHVRFNEVPAAKAYYVWVSTHPDGQAALNMTPGGAKNGDLVYGLRPALKLYFWVTYQDAKGSFSRPSAAASATLVDTFQEK